MTEPLFECEAGDPSALDAPRELAGIPGTLDKSTVELMISIN